MSARPASPAHSDFGWSAAFFAANQLLEASMLLAMGFAPMDLLRWDAEWFCQIVGSGYDTAPWAGPRGEYANWAFFPLFPLLAALLKLATGLSPEVAVLVTGKLCFLAAIFAFVRFTRVFAPAVRPAVAAGVAAFQPCAIYGSVGYSEALFLLLTCSFFLALKNRATLSAGALGALLGATRVVGLGAGLAWIVAVVRGEIPWNQRTAVAFLLLPFGLAVFMVLLYLRTGDALAFLHIQTAWGRLPANPAAVVAEGLLGDGMQMYYAITAMAALAAPLFLVRRGQFELAAFSWFGTLVPLSTSLVAMPRFVWWQAPLLLLVALMANHKRVWIVLLPLGVVAVLLMYILWFSGHEFVV